MGPAVPTSRLERELRKLYLRWLSGLPAHERDLTSYIETFRVQSEALIRRMGGDIARLGVYLADFPAPRELELSPYAGKIYDEMQTAAIRAGIMTGLNATDVARAMLVAGLDKSFHKLNRLARTETVSAYWKNQWDSTRGLGLVLVWSAEIGKRTCDYCLDRDGLVVEDPNIRDHPNGRCTLVPTLPSRVQYKGTLQPDGSVTMDPRWQDPSYIDFLGRMPGQASEIQV
ncbi:capsid maturation protease [Microbacterium phage GaeCeo]|nr:capsid maturation protease [Microbacterium phage GaeCeo]